MSNATTANVTGTQAVSSSRLGSLDGMRGWAALVVFFHHALNIFYPTLAGLVREDLHPHRHIAGAMHVLPLGWLFNGPFAVSFFFVLSGFVLTLQVQRGGQRPLLRGLVVQRFLRLFPLVFVASLLGWLAFSHSIRGLDSLLPFSGIAAKDVFNPTLFNDTSIGTWLMQTFYGIWHNQAASGLFDPVLWSIGAEFQGSVLLYVVLCSLDGMRVSLKYVTALILLVLFIGPFGVCFVVGMGVAERLQKYGYVFANGALRIALPAVVLWACVCPYSGNAWLPFPWSMPEGLRICFNALAASVMLAAGLQFSWSAKIFSRRPARFMGAVSYGFYVIHMPFLYGVAAPLVARYANTVDYDIAVVLACGLALALALGAGHLLIVFVDAPLNQLSKRWVRRAVLGK